ncbi:MAG: glycosyltransferase [Trueperaceae bacterium]|nr:glycosyltransferase [Trueperaceae bacterium]
MNAATSKSITFVITSLVFAGAQSQVMALMKSLKKRGWDVRLISMMAPEAHTEELDQLGIPWASLDMARGAADPRALFKLRSILREWQPTIVHSHMVHANLLARLARVLTKMPLLISTAHNVSEGGRIRELAYRLTDPLCELTTNVSQAAVDRYVSIGAVPQTKIKLVVNGIDASRFVFGQEAREKKRAELGLDETFSYLAVGRFDPEKDYPNMFAAFKKLLETQRAKLLVVGHGGIDMPTLVKDYGLENDVEILGLRKDVPELMSAVDAYLMSSAWEGLPMVLLEAAASGLPIVATDVGGNAEVVQNGKTGYIVPAQNADALAKAMLELQTLSSEGRLAMGQTGRAYVKEHYDIERIVDKWESIYLEQLAKKGMTVSAK